MAFDSRQFILYHPHTTYSNKDNSCFISSGGKSRGELNTDTAALFRTGRKAYDLIFPDCSKVQFDQAYEVFLFCVEEWRNMLLEMCQSNSIKMLGSTGRNSLSVPSETIRDADESQITSMVWQLLTAQEKAVQMELEEAIFMALALVFQTLRNIDDCLMLNAMEYAIEATTALSNAEALLLAIKDSSDPSDSKTAASVMAKLSHKEHYALADYAMKHWQAHISPTLSNQKAATELTKIVPLSHKKLAEYVSKWKK